VRQRRRACCLHPVTTGTRFARVTESVQARSSGGYITNTFWSMLPRKIIADHSTGRFRQPASKDAAKWGEALMYLVSNAILTKPEELFASRFYTLMSDAGVHPLIAEREYARLMRNMSIEYGLLLLSKLDKLGL
jgi:hypothetical protein